MTVNYEVPAIKYIGNGSITDFAFRWSCGDPNENYVTVDGVPQTEGIQYELEDFTLDVGGTVRFNEAPADDAVIIIYRQTPITQQVDYEDDDPFPADTHEFQMDKDTRILQEIIEAGRALGGRVDLEGVQFEEYVEVTNTGGTNAILPPWTCDGLKAGVSIGEVVEFGEEAPIHGANTEKHDGYLWWILGQPPAAGGDVNIRVATAPIIVDIGLPPPYTPVAEFRFNAETGNVEYGFDPDSPAGLPTWTERPGILVLPTEIDKYWVRADLISGGATERNNSPLNQWIDVYVLSETTEKYCGWFVQALGGSPVEAVLHFTIAPDDGASAPDLGRAVSVEVTLKAEQT